MILSNTNNNYSGTTTVAAGMLSVANTGTLPGFNTAGYVYVDNGATLTLQVGGTAGWTSASIGKLLLANSTGFTAGSVLGIDTTPAGTNGSSYNYPIAGNMGLTLLGPNPYTLSGSNTYTGPTLVSGGTLVLNNSKALQNSTLIATAAGSVNFSSYVSSRTFTFGGLSGAAGVNLTLEDNAATPDPITLIVGNNNASTTFAGVLSDAGSNASAGSSLVKIGSGTLTLTGSNTYTGSTTINGGALQLGDGTSGNDGSLASTASITDNASLIFNFASQQSYAGVITGSGNFVKAGGGRLTLTSTSTYTGGTTVSGGVLDIPNNTTLSSRGVWTVAGPGSIVSRRGSRDTLRRCRAEQFQPGFSGCFGSSCCGKHRRGFHKFLHGGPRHRLAYHSAVGGRGCFACGRRPSRSARAFDVAAFGRRPDGFAGLCPAAEIVRRGAA